MSLFETLGEALKPEPYRLSCGCIPDASGYGYCSKCVTALRTKIWKKMSHKDKEYDRHFAPEQSKELDDKCSEDFRGDSGGCSCHINPPCSYCEHKNDEDE